jgi:hypothetical protein
MVHSFDCKVPKTPLSIQKRKPNSFAHVARKTNVGSHLFVALNRAKVPHPLITPYLLRRADHNHMPRQRPAEWYTCALSASKQINRYQDVVTRLARRRAEGLLCSASKRGKSEAVYSLRRILA